MAHTQKVLIKMLRSSKNIHLVTLSRREAWLSNPSMLSCFSFSDRLVLNSIIQKELVV
jgi:hypothetical protein